MKFSRNAQIALAVGWFVLLFILLGTSESAVSNVAAIGINLRSIIYGSRPSDVFFFLGTLGAVALLLLALLALVYLWRAWTYVINLTRLLVSFFFFQKSTSESDLSVEPNMLQTLFGKDPLTSKDSLLWRLLQSLLSFWVILFLIILIGSIISALSRY